MGPYHVGNVRLQLSVVQMLYEEIRQSEEEEPYTVCAYSIVGTL